MSSERDVGLRAVEDNENKQLYLMLGRIEAKQDHQQKMIEEATAKISKMESRINYAIGIVTTIIFFFQAGITYLTKTGKA